MKIAVAGAGAFGTALAIALKAGERDVALWGRQSEAMDTLLASRISPHLPGVPLPDSLPVSANIDSVLEADVVLLAVPAQSLDGFLGQQASCNHDRRIARIRATGNRRNHHRAVADLAGISIVGDRGRILESRALEPEPTLSNRSLQR